MKMKMKKRNNNNKEKSDTHLWEFLVVSVLHGFVDVVLSVTTLLVIRRSQHYGIISGY